MKRPVVNIFWFRRDLRLHDNRGLSMALSGSNPVVPIFIFDREILDRLENPRDLRVVFIHQQLKKLEAKLVEFNSSLLVYYGTVISVFERLAEEFSIEQIFCNGDYEPYAESRDKVVKGWSNHRNIGFNSYQDQVVFEKDQLVKTDGSPYLVFTPYMRKWKAQLQADLQRLKSHRMIPSNFYSMPARSMVDLNQLGFSNNSSYQAPVAEIDLKKIASYHQNRDFPATNGTTRLSVHLRFGTMSIRELVKVALQHQSWLNELIWREFYMMILWHFPQVTQRAFKPAYDHISWRNNEDEFQRWCQGQTGYPIVDAGMRELNTTGFMHNRLRMITASFLAKHLLIDWRWGEAYFAAKLLDFELASNNGGWQWTVGCGCDAAPYFRVFNPWLQAKKFDPESKYITHWVPEYQNSGYPKPMVDHKFARNRAIETYRQTLQKQ